MLLPSRSLRAVLAPAALFLLPLSSLPLLLTGCSAATSTAASASKAAFIAGNWQFSSVAPAAVHLSGISGELSGSAAAVTGILHAQLASACVAPTTAVTVAGSADANGALTLTGAVAGGTLTINGTLAADGRSLSGAVYNVAGGTCAFAKPADAVAQAYMPLSGSYTGSFRDSDGLIATVQATLNQSADANGDGNYTLTGTSTPNNPCFSTTVPISNTSVTGGNFTFTYTDPNTTNSVTASGTFSSDASTLTVANWTLSGPCGADTGTGSMSRQ